MLRVVGIVALIVLAACAQTSSQTALAPSPVIAQGNWTQNLTFSGDVSGVMTGIVPDSGTQESTCSGAKARNGETWADSFFGAVDASGDVWQFSIVIENFRGPGAYQNRDVALALQSPDNTRTWLNQGPDKVTLTVERSQQTGTIDAFLTNASSGKSGSEHITGRWNCRG